MTIQHENIYARIAGAIVAARAEHNACTATEIARRIRVHKTHVGHVLHEMRALGLITFTDMPGSIQLVGSNDRQTAAEDAEAVGAVATIGALATRVTAKPQPAKKMSKAAAARARRVPPIEVRATESAADLRARLSPEQLAAVDALAAKAPNPGRSAAQNAHMEKMNAARIAAREARRDAVLAQQEADEVPAS